MISNWHKVNIVLCYKTGLFFQFYALIDLLELFVYTTNVKLMMFVEFVTVPYNIEIV